MRDAPTLLATVPEGVAVVSMIVFQDRLFVALSNGLYVFHDEKFVPVPIFMEPPQ